MESYYVDNVTNNVTIAIYYIKKTGIITYYCVLYSPYCRLSRTRKSMESGHHYNLRRTLIEYIPLT